MSICLHIVYVYITMAELCSCNREPKIYYLALNRKCLTTPHWYNPFSQHHQRAVPPNLACTPQPPTEGIPTTSQSNPLFFTALSSRNFWLLFIFQGSPFRPPESANPSLLTSPWMGKRASPQTHSPTLAAASLSWFYIQESQGPARGFCHYPLRVPFLIRSFLETHIIFL